MFRVQKKDGTLEDFDSIKLTSGITKAGASEEEAQKVLSVVEAWLPTVAVDGVVKSFEIKNKVLESLNETNPAAVTNFESYKKAQEN
ncbi:MAG TPA: ATP cone domain-containing protein [Candidatus Humimicrobiaceae bacterium]|nr:ATP cone domain-containing protein [Candidatus Humimicrobiaceae bacterium]